MTSVTQRDVCEHSLLIMQNTSLRMHKPRVIELSTFFKERGESTFWEGQTE